MYDELNENRQIETVQKEEVQNAQHEAQTQDTPDQQQDVQQLASKPKQQQHDKVQHANGAQEQQEPTEEDADYDEDEEYDDEDYMPDFIQERLDNPPLWAGESKDEFQMIFDIYDLENPRGRPKTDVEFILAYQATVSTWELLRYDRMKVAIVNSQQGAAAEIVYRKSYGDVVGDGDPHNGKATQRKFRQAYFADPEFRKAYSANLAATGFAANAIEAEAFLRSLPTLMEVERMIRATEKRLADVQAKLEAAYASRDPETKLPKSCAADRNERRKKEPTQERSMITRADEEKLATVFAQMRKEGKE